MRQLLDFAMRAKSIVLLVVLALIGLAAVAYPARTDLPRSVVVNGLEVTDGGTFVAVAERLRAGEPYYQAVGVELRRRGYPTADTFNWRTPLHLTVIAWAPWFVSRAALTVLLALLFGATMGSAPRGRPFAWTAGVLQMGVLVLAAAPDAVYSSEAWAGALVGLSVCAFTFQRPAPAIALGLAALFVRELAAPYCVVCTVIAAYRRQWKQCAGWLGGGGAYALYFARHVAQVWAHRLPTDQTHASGWVEFGGLPFLQSTIQALGGQADLPGAFNALVVLLLASGIACTTAPIHVRAASGVYAGFFLIVGKPFNGYWGWIAAPTWTIACGYGAVHALAAVRAVIAPPTGVRDNE